VNNPITRVYATPLAQPIHTDSADLVALLSLRMSKSGGLSSWASSVSVHNELLRLGRKARINLLCSSSSSSLLLVHSVLSFLPLHDGGLPVRISLFPVLVCMQRGLCQRLASLAEHEV
jgi:hypothetical protein